MHFQMDRDEWNSEHLQRDFHLQKEFVISLNTRPGNRKLRQMRLILSTTEILHTQTNAFHPQTIKHFFFFIKASTTLVSHRIAEAKLVNHLSRVRQYNMVLSALWPCFSSAYLALLCCLDNVLVDNRLSIPVEPCKSQPPICPHHAWV